MKKKIYFITSSIIQILIFIFLLITVNHTIQTLLNNILKLYSINPTESTEKLISFYENKGIFYLCFCYIISIILSIFTIQISLNNNILKKKGLLFAFSLINLGLPGNFITNLLSIINIIVLIFSKRKNPEDYPSKEDREIPIIEYAKSTKKEIILAIVLILLYFSLYLLPLNALNLSFAVTLTIVIIYYLVTFLSVIIVYRKKLIEDFKLLKNNYKAYFYYLVKKYILIFIPALFINFIIISFITKTINVNQTTINNLSKLIAFPLVVIYAPIVEELIFRESLRKIIHNKVLFIIVSAIIFGLLHTVHEQGLVNTLVCAIPYMVIGGGLAYTYTNTNNITNTIALHFTQNALIMILQILFL